MAGILVERMLFPSKKGENISDSTQRRLSEELGFTCPLQHISSFHYKADYDKEFGENEIDHVFVGQFDGVIKPNKDEIDDWNSFPSKNFRMMFINIRKNSPRGLKKPFRK